MIRSFEGKTALVTGGTRGMGLEIARELLRGGAKVAVVARKPESLEEARTELASEGELLAIQANVSNPDDVARMVKDTIDTLGGLELLVNNVGVSPYFGPLVDAPAEALAKTFQSNVIGALGAIQAAWHGRMREHGGSIVNISSVGAHRTAENLGAYALTKAALSHMTRQLSYELAPTVRVNAVAPAIIKTRFSKARYEGHEQELLARYPMGRLGRPEDVSKAVCFLLSDDAAWITGEVLDIDGGALKVDTA